MVESSTSHIFKTPTNEFKIKYIKMVQEGNKLSGSDLKEWANKYAQEVGRYLNRFSEILGTTSEVSEHQVQLWYKEISKALSLCGNTFKAKDSSIPGILAKVIQKTAANLEKKVPFFAQTLTDQKDINDMDEAVS